MLPGTERGSHNTGEYGALVTVSDFLFAGLA